MSFDNGRSGHDRFPFGKRTPVLDFGPRSMAKPGRGYQWIAWPAWAWRVVAPLPRHRSLNVFQRAVMKLAVAGKRRADELAGLLELDRELVALVITELQGRGALDEHGAPTGAGKAILEKDSDEEPELVSGHLFQDPESLDLWPRFAERVSFAEVEFRDGDAFPTLLRGSKGGPKPRRLYTVLPGNVPEPALPRPEQIVEALQSHFHTLRRSRRASPDLEDEELSWADADVAKLADQYLDRVDLVDDEPTPYFLLSFVYFPANEADAAGWRVCDPFGLGDSMVLRRRMEARMREDDRLRELVSQVVGEEVDAAQGTWRAMLDRLEEWARETVRLELTSNIETHQDLFKRLVRMERKWQELAHSGDAASRESVAEFFVSAQLVIEHLLHTWLADQPRIEEDVLAKGGRARDYNRARFESAAEDCGFTTPLPESLGHVRGGKVLNALKGGMGSLRPLLLAVLLKAQHAPEHPVRRWGKAVPGFLERLDDLAQLRDRAAHAAKGHHEKEDPQMYRELVYDAVSLGLDLPRSASART